MSYKQASWGKALAGWLGSLGLSFTTWWGWSGSLLTGAVMSSSDDPRLRSVGNGMLGGVATATGLVALGGTALIANWDTFKKYVPLPPNVGGPKPFVAGNSTTLAGPATYAGNYYYWKNWHEKRRQEEAAR